REPVLAVGPTNRIGHGGQRPIVRGVLGPFRIADHRRRHEVVGKVPGFRQPRPLTPVLWVPPNAMSFLVLLITKQIEPKSRATSSADHCRLWPVGATARGCRWMVDDVKYSVFMGIFLFRGVVRTRRGHCQAGRRRASLTTGIDSRGRLRLEFTNALTKLHA